MDTLKITVNKENNMQNNALAVVKSSIPVLKTYEPSEYKCYLFGSTEEFPGLVWCPDKRTVPNAFVRFMMKVLLGCTWVKTKEGE